MTTTYKVLGQVVPSATTDTTLYTVPSATSTVVSTLTACNLGPASTTFRVAVRPAGAALANVHYTIYDNVVSSNDTIFLTIGATLATTDVITVRSASGTVAFTAFGSEIT